MSDNTVVFLGLPTEGVIALSAALVLGLVMLGFYLHARTHKPAPLTPDQKKAAELLAWTTAKERKKAHLCPERVNVDGEIFYCEGAYKHEGKHHATVPYGYDPYYRVATWLTPLGSALVKR